MVNGRSETTPASFEAEYFTLSKIVNYQPPPSLALRQDQIHVFKVPNKGRIPIKVLGYGQDNQIWIADW
jgi:hypothetical protein